LRKPVAAYPELPLRLSEAVTACPGEDRERVRWLSPMSRCKLFVRTITPTGAIRQQIPIRQLPDVMTRRPQAFR